MSQYYDAFISYGRADSKAFATQLYNDLTEAGFKIWFDQNDIPLGVDFQNQIDDGIEKAHNFLFIIGPHSVNSPYCLKEIELAVKYKKRIIPLLHVEQISYETWQERNPNKTEADWEEYQAKGLHSSFPNMHPEIRKINWVYFRENVDNYHESLAGLIKLFHRDEDYVQKHTQIFAKALEWERHQKLTRYLLVGKERQEAEKWLKTEFKNEQIPCISNDLQCEYICESIKNANNLLTQVFLSYAEENRKKMDKIRISLMRQGITVWTSKTDIKTGSEFEEAINRGIEGADNLVYLLSPESLESTYCQQELARAFSLNKRITALLVKPTDLETMPQELQKLQFIDLTNEEESLKNLDKLIKELRDNAVYYEQHKVLLVKGLKWQEQNRNASILLRGYNLEHYQSWLEVARTKKLHPPTDLQKQFIAESAKQPPDLVLDVFISYSRADSDFARRLNDALQTQGKTTWFDQESIATGTDFAAEINRGIEQSDNFLFIISPDSVNSPYCADEVEYARSLNKRFVTVLHRGVNSGELHPELAKVQWLDFNRYGGDFLGNFSELVRMLDTDREYVREHTKKSQAALEWTQGDKSVDLLLRGNECNRAYEWLHEAQQQRKQPELTEWLKEYIIASKNELERLQKRELRIQRRDKLILSGFLALMTGLSIFSGFQTVNAKREREIALARQLAAESESMRLRHRSLHEGSGLLAVEAIAKFQKLNLPLVTADRALRGSLSLLPDFLWGANSDGAVTAVAFSPDGKYLATASEDRTARVRSLITEEEIVVLKHDGAVNAVAFSPDGKYLATASEDRTARVRSLVTGEEIVVLKHDGAVNAVAFSANNNYLATASEDRTARVWNHKASKEVARLKHDKEVKAVTFSPDGKYLITGSLDATARVWDGTTGQEIARLKHNGVVWTVAFSPDGKYVATASADRAARVWDAATGQEIARFDHDDTVLDVAFSADGQYVVTASEDKTAGVWDVATGKEIARVNHDRPLKAVAFSADGKYFATASEDRLAGVWKIATGQDVASVNHDGVVVAVAFIPDGKYIATASADRTARVWDVATGQEIARFNHDDTVLDVAFSADGQYVATASEDKTAEVWDPATGKEVIRINHDDIVRTVAFSPDGKYLATASDDNTARVWDAATGEEVIRIDRDDVVFDLDWSADGKYVAAASYDRTAGVWNAVTGKKVAQFDHDGVVTAVVFSGNGKYVATASTDKTARVWDAVTGEEVTRVKHDDEIWAVAFSADSKYVATASDDKTARVWDAVTGSEVSRVNHDDEVWVVAFSPDGKYFATASDDNTAGVWDRVTGAEITRISHDGWVFDVAISADGKYLATTSQDKTARVHLFKAGALVKEACRRLRRNLTADEWERYMNLDLNKYHKTCDNLPVHPSVLAKGGELAKEGEVKEAVAIFRRALKLQPDIDLNPDTEEIDNNPEAVAREFAAD